ncbi:hypothetical protein RclHR1_01270005 [Rhizophagus clarus]|nr:hypothetical protein RclHR1_01270005 [Rhizophagus clarus]
MLSIDHQIFYISTPLESLSELICDSSTCSSYFYELAQTCQNIQRFIVINAIVSVNDGIIKLIEVQKNLKYFEWKDNFEEVVDNFMDMDDPYYNEMLLTLVKKSDMIDHLILLFHYDGHKLFEILSKFSKLKTLTLNKYCLKDTIIPMYYDLETLKVDHITINAAVNLITNSGGKLKEVLFKYNGYYNNEYSVETYAKETLNLIHKTYKCCSLVEILSLIFPLTTDHFIEFENLLKNCHNLKKLTLIIDDINIDGNDYERSSENVKKLLQILVKSAPIGLKEIKIFNDFIPYLESLKILEKWRDQNIIICLGVLKDFHF